MPVYMRNKRTGEFKDVDPDSREMRDLQAQRDPDNPAETVWEQTHDAHVDAVKDRAAYGELKEEDLGKDHAEQLPPVPGYEEDAHAEAEPWRNLTPGEIEAGLTPEQKAEDMKAMLDERTGEARAGVLDEAADAIADERKKRDAAAASEGQLARAGGSDDREDVPRPSASGGKSKSKSSGSSGGSGGGSSSSGSSSSE